MGDANTAWFNGLVDEKRIFSGLLGGGNDAAGRKKTKKSNDDDTDDDDNDHEEKLERGGLGCAFGEVADSIVWYLKSELKDAVVYTTQDSATIAPNKV